MDVRTKPHRVRLILDPKERFPEKLYDVAGDNYLVKWNSAGTAVLVNDSCFEQNVMQSYPGFVQIPTFLNLRRLFREYAFDWHTEDSSTFKFSHPYFVRGQHELLTEIKTRRKAAIGFSPSPLSFRNHSLPLGRTSTPLGKTRSLRIRGRRRRRREANSDSDFSDIEASGGDSLNDPDSLSKRRQLEEEEVDVNPAKWSQPRHVKNNIDREAFMSEFARNELDDSEYREFLRRQELQAIQSSYRPVNIHAEENFTHAGDQWMYVSPEVSRSSDLESAGEWSSFSDNNFVLTSSRQTGSFALQSPEAAGVSVEEEEEEEEEEVYFVDDGVLKAFPWSSTPTMYDWIEDS